MPAPPRPVHPNHVSDPLRPRNPLVARRWILGGIGFMLLASLVAVYFAIGLLFWQGQWQLIFHPSHVVANTPAGDGVPFDDVRFDATEAGHTRLTGWWVSGKAQTSGKRRIILYLHDARGSLSDALPDILALHALGEDVFAFDPRGFGKSEWAKPSESHWNQDADAALYYLASVRHIGPSHVIAVGRGLGATIAANLTRKHGEMKSLVMIDPQPPTLVLLESPRWTHLLPVRLLARDHFDPSAALSSTSVDKIFLLPANATIPAYVTRAVPPITAVHGTVLGKNETAAALQRFLAQYPSKPGN
jgi:pimeloyl-ACP methyl ester carboxylesterase